MPARTYTNKIRSWIIYYLCETEHVITTEDGAGANPLHVFFKDLITMQLILFKLQNDGFVNKVEIK